MNKKLFGVSIAAVMLLSVGLMSACAKQEYVMPGWSGVNDDDANMVSVHDPSIFYDEASSTYYAFGTHYAVASSPDMLNWTQQASDNQWQKLYGETAYTYSAGGKSYQWPLALKETVDLVQPEYRVNNGNDETIISTWAPDVEEYNGKYYMYYSLTKRFGSRESAIGRVEADSPMGPYSKNVVIVDSMGGSGNDPNCIDPELFYDKDGGLWMVYGSFFGGIYIKELHNSGNDWGLPKEDGFGTRLWGSSSSGMEGPFIFYNEETNYYYLMTSHGDLNKDYNMRVARSENPDGPYKDITGDTMEGNSGGGVKLAGNYIIGDEALGYAAIGHNSVVEKDGEFLVVAHSRRQASAGSESVLGVHHVYVFQLYFNEDGWPVMNPNRYAGEKLGVGMTMENVADTYDVVLHTEGTTDDFVQSQEYVFAADGTVSAGSESIGTWTLSGDYYVTITLTGGDWKGTYKGVVTPSWDNMYTASAWDGYATFSMTAVSDTGRPLWAVGTTAKT